MFMGMHDFDFCPNLIKFIYILSSLPKFYPIYPNLPNFTQICPNFTQNGLNFIQIYLKYLIGDAAASKNK